MPPREYGARPVDHEALDPDDIYNDGGEESLCTSFKSFRGTSLTDAVVAPCSDTYKAEFKNDLPHIDTMPGSNRPVQATGMKGTVMTQSNDPKKSNRLGTVSAHSSAARDGSGPRIPAKRMAEDHQERGGTTLLSFYREGTPANCSSRKPKPATSRPRSVRGSPSEEEKGPSKKEEGPSEEDRASEEKKGQELARATDTPNSG
jgi:hypothetical protein